MSSPQHITRTGQFLTRVHGVESLSPRMRRITLTSPEIAARDWPLACDIAVVLTGEDGREVRRRYTVREVDGQALVVDAVLHGHGPGSTWAAGAAADDPVTFFGPRGEVPLEPADWTLALTDEAGLPAVAALVQARPGHRVTVLAEIEDAAETYPLGADAEVTWLTRDGAAAGTTALLSAGVQRLADTAVIPGDGRGFAYVLGESRAIVTLRDELARFGLSRQHVYAKGYWNLNSRPTR